MQKILLNLILSLFLISVAGTLQAQDTITREVWLDRLVSVMYAEDNLSPEDEDWVKKILSATCDCNAIEDEDEGRECGKELLKKENLPVEEVDFKAMTPEQLRKFSLLAPLVSSMLGDCPE